MLSNSVNTQLKRSWRLGLLAKDMARVRLSKDEKTREQARHKLVQRMGALHGLPQKIGQILSLSELTGEEKTYTPLTESTPAVPAQEALEEIARQLERPLSRCFQEVESEGISASLGQVHRAVLLDGRRVAVKFQYPGIAETIEHDLKALGWLTAPMGGLKRGFDVKDYQREVGSRLHEELDYRHEARTLKHFAHFVSGWDDVEVPQVIDELSGDRILTMTWLEGEPFSADQSWSQEERQQLGATLLRLFLTSCLRWGYLHADPHPGNYRFSRRNGKPVVGLLDFGCVKRLDRETVKALRYLLYDVIEGKLDDDPERALALYLALGFKRDALEPMQHLLAPLSRVLFEPFLTRKPFPPSQWRMGERVEEVLGDFRWNFRFAGPANLIYFMRAYQGIVQYLEALDVPVNWREILDEAAGKTERPATPVLPVVAKRQAKARTLKIQVLENNRQKVALTFQAHCAENLPELLPPDLEEKLAARAIDVHRIAEEAAVGGFEPGELFILEENNKSIRVWLE